MTEIAAAYGVNTAPQLGTLERPGVLVLDLGTRYRGVALGEIGSDGSILVLGAAGNFSESFDPSSSVLLARITPRGSFDPSFGSSGVVRTALTGPDYPMALSLFPDDSFAVAGSAGLPRRVVAAAFDAAGTIDSANFAVQSPGLSASTARGTCVLALEDGKVLVGGTAFVGGSSQAMLVRFGADGTLDPAFNGSGATTTDASSATDTFLDIALQPDGKIVATGYADNSGNMAGVLLVARYTADGQLDASFGNAGLSRLEVSGVFASGSAVEVQQDGGIVVAGGVTTPSYEMILSRFSSDGTLDTTFAGDGVIQFSLASGGYLTDVAVQEDGKIVAVGSVRVAATDAGWVQDIIVVRVHPDGTPDATFGAGGVVVTDLGRDLAGDMDDDTAQAVRVLPGGQIVVTGASFNGRHYDTVVLRYLEDGSLDTSFGGGSRVDYTLGEAAVALDPALSVWDQELAIADTGFQGAGLRLAREGGPSAQDGFFALGRLGPLVEGGTLSFDGDAIGEVVRNSGGELVLSFGVASKLQIDSALQHIAFSTTASEGLRIEWRFEDGNAGSQGTGPALAASMFTAVNIVTPVEGGAGNDTLAGHERDDRVRAYAGADTLEGGSGDDILDGGEGLDLAVYAGSRASYDVSRLGHGWQVEAAAAGEGTDELWDVERLAFADARVALDLDGHAGSVARILTAVVGVNLPHLATIGLQYADGGMSHHDLTELALHAMLGDNPTNDAVISLLYYNVTGGAVANEAVLEIFRPWIVSGGYTQTTFAMFAGDYVGIPADVLANGLLYN